MGPGAPRMCCTAAVTLVLVVLILVADRPGYRVAADRAKVDSDLVFETLDHTETKSHDNHLRIAREVADPEEIVLQDSAPPPEEQGWLSSTVSRIRRSISGLLGHNNKADEAHSRTRRRGGRVPRQDPDGQQEADDDYDEDYVNGENENNGPGDYEANENEDEEYSEQDEDEYADVNENGEEEDVQIPVHQHIVTTTESQTTIFEPVLVQTPGPEPEGPRRGDTTPPLNIDSQSNASAAHNRNATQVFSNDDEDLGVDSSGWGGSGDVETPRVGRPYYSVPLPPTVSPTHPVYFRISLTVNEPYVDQYKDRNSLQYQDFTQDFVSDLESLYEDVSGRQSATVIKIEKRETDLFTIKVTADLGSEGNSDERLIRDTLYDQIRTIGRIGRFTVYPDDFQFRVFEARNAFCQPNEISCRDGQCVPTTARCDGIPQCADNSDELGCPTDRGVPIIPEETTTERIVDEPITPVDGGSGDGEEPLSQRPQSSSCRADDVVRCADDSRTICSDQLCDGVEDCDDGADEDNCPHECARGEHGCDITRCIPIIKVCDGVKDCTDGTDENECAQCKPEEHKCDDICLAPSKVCDRVPDCRDQSDERNCPGV